MIQTATASDALCSLFEYMEKVSFFEYLRCYGNTAERYGALSLDAYSSATPILAGLLRLFILGEWIPSSLLRSMLPRDLVEKLRSCNILMQHNQVWSMNGLRFVDHFGTIVLCGVDSLRTRFYYGADSVALGQLALRAQGLVLDLCAGIGTQSVLAARRAERIVAVETDLASMTLFDLNVAINHLGDRVTLCHGDLFEPVDRMVFDTILMNPPLVPVLDELPFPSLAAGGSDGLRFQRRFLAGIARHLTRQGVAYSIGGCLGDDEGPWLDSLHTIAKSNNLAVSIFTTGRADLSVHGDYLTALSETASLFANTAPQDVVRSHVQLYNTIGATYVYWFYLVARHCTTGNADTWQICRADIRGGTDWYL